MSSDKKPDVQRQVLIEDLGEELQKAHKKGVTLQTRLQQLKAESIGLDVAIERYKFSWMRYMRQLNMGNR